MPKLVSLIYAAHDLSEDWKLKSDTLKVMPTKGKQDNKLITKEWKQNCKEYDLIQEGIDNTQQKNHLSMTTHTAANVKTARTKAKSDLQFDNESDCLDHQLHLLVEESVAENGILENAINKAHNIATHFS